MLLFATVLLTSCKDDETVVASAVSLDKSTLSLVAGTTGTLTATITPDDVEVKDLSWMSCDKSIATVDDKGVVTAVKVGKATITVVTRSGGKTASCIVTVTAAPIPVTGITLDKTALSLGIDDKEKLTPTIAPEDATNTNVKWTSSDDKIATVSATGEVTAVAVGIATITATTEDGGKTATCVVTITDRPAYMFYGMKNGKTVFYDGAEMTQLGNGEEGVISGVLVDNDFYALDAGFKLFKNGKVITDNKIAPTTDIRRAMNFYRFGKSFYIYGMDKDSEYCYWKDGQKKSLPYSSTERSRGLCALGDDMFFAARNMDEKRLVIYKNNVKVFDYDNQDGRDIEEIVVYDGKVYASLYGGTECSLYVYNGTTFDKVKTVAGDSFEYFASDGTSFYAAIKSGDQTDIYKGVDWSTALPRITLPEDNINPTILSILGEGSDSYIYVECRLTDENHSLRAYCWKNGTDPVRLLADTIDVLVHMPK